MVKKDNSMTRKELCGELYNQYRKDGKEPDGNHVVLTRAEFDKKVLKSKNHQSKAKLKSQLERRTTDAKKRVVEKDVKKIRRNKKCLKNISSLEF